MIKYYTYILTIFFIVTLFSANAIAEQLQKENNLPITITSTTNSSKIFILSMHGQSQYTNNSSYLSYVNPDAPKTGNIKIAAIGTFDTLNPYSLKGQAPQNINLIYDRLMRRIWDEPFTMVPLIAQYIELANDRSWITFHINPKARFNDNSPITAQDVLFSFETLREHGRPNMRRIYKLVKKVNIISPNIIHFDLGKGYDRETIMILSLMPILSKKWWEGRNFDTTLTIPPVTSGPYTIDTFSIGHRITYKLVNNYWAKDLLANKGLYNFNSITYDYFRDDTIALEAFKKGNLDIRREYNVSKWENAYTHLNNNIIRKEFPHKRPERTRGFFFNMRRPPFNDINVRKALTLAFAEEWIRKNIFYNKFKRIKSFFPNSVLAAPYIPSSKEIKLLTPWKDNLQDEVFIHKGYGLYENPDLLNNIEQQVNKKSLPKQHITMREKLRRADYLLKQSGWIIKEGKRINKDTKDKMILEILISSKQEEKIALTYKQTLKRLGITFNIHMADSATFQKRKNIYDYDMIAAYWQNSLSPGSEQMLYWSCDAAKKMSRFNYSGICNPALDNFANKIANAKTYDELTTYTHIVDRIGLSEYIFIPLFYKNIDFIAYNKNLIPPQKTPIYGTVLESWWRSKTTQ